MIYIIPGMREGFFRFNRKSSVKDSHMGGGRKVCQRMHEGGCEAQASGGRNVASQSLLFGSVRSWSENWGEVNL